MNTFWDPSTPAYVPLAREQELREVAAERGVHVQIHSRARRACAPAIELKTAQPTRRLGMFATCARAIAFLEGGQQ